MIACPSCGAGRPARGAGCPRCGWEPTARTRPRRRADLGTAAWTRRSRTARELHVDTHGLVCPGFAPTGHDAHPVDSIGELALHEIDGPGSHPDRCVVLCRQENGRIGAPW